MVGDVIGVTDPRGAQWTVRRRRWYGMSNFGHGGGNEIGELVLLPLLAVAWWPIWFVAHWFGLPWRIVIKRGGNDVYEIEVRGWRKSRRRIQEVAESAAVGTLSETTP